MSYAIQEVFYTLQGEGGQAGRPAVFCRFTGCNLWSGREQHRHRAICQFCDTEFVGMNGENGGRYADARVLADRVAAQWPSADTAERYVVLTGGEPALQVDAELIQALRAEGFETAIETNGTLPLKATIDWICVSPKAGAPLRVRGGNELKLVYPQPGAEPEQFQGLSFQHFFLQPMDGPDAAANTAAAVDYCKANPRWRLSLQTHKVLDIP
jgi:7-carboxy-7-deazaguanine synthase (Cx14CxxC type)